MAIVVPNIGEGEALSFFVAKANPSPLVLKLFSNNIIPSESDVASSFSEVSGSVGYAPVTLNGADWTITEGSPSLAQHPQVTFTFSAAAGLIYGYFVVREGNGVLSYSERFTDGPYNITANGDQIKITPKITFE